VPTISRPRLRLSSSAVESPGAPDDAVPSPPPLGPAGCAAFSWPVRRKDQGITVHRLAGKVVLGHPNGVQTQLFHQPRIRRGWSSCCSPYHPAVACPRLQWGAAGGLAAIMASPSLPARAPAGRSRLASASSHGRAPCPALRSEALPHPLGDCKQGAVFVPLADQLGADRQTLGPGEHGQREGRNVGGGP